MTTGTWNAHKDQIFDVGTLSIGGTQVTATAAELNALDGITATVTELNKLDGVGAAVASGAQVSNIADLAVVFSSNDPSITPDSSITIANGSTPTVAELQEFCVELNTKVSAIIAALEAYGIAASS